MKFALTHFLLYLLLATHVCAKETPAPSANAQFIENKGQVTDQRGAVRKDIDVKIEANGVVMFVGGGELHYQFYRSQTPIAIGAKVKTQKDLSGASVPPPSAKLTPPPAGDNAISEVEIYRMDVKLVGANKNAEVIFEEPTGYYENYYLAHMGEEGVRAKGYGRITYKNIYPNIDLVLYTEANSKVKSQNPKETKLLSNIEYQTSNIKYDFIVHPGGNPADIQLRYEGATELKLVDGALITKTPYGTITEAAPYSYNAVTKEPVSSAYKLSGNKLSFDVGSYTGTLVIDPVLKWATYYGGNNEDRIYSSATDRCGNVYIGGYTSSSNNIATSGAHQTSFTGNTSGLLAKFDMYGVRQWGTYYGGYETVIYGLACNAEGHLYVTGATRDTVGFSTTGAHQGNSNGGPSGFTYDAFLAKFNMNGQRVWGTYYGGSDADYGITAACDTQGNIYIAGMTSSANSIATSGSAVDTLPYYITGVAGTTIGYVAKFNPNGVREWGSYYYGVILDLDCDKLGNIYIGGGTRYPVGVATPGAYSTSIVAGGGGAWTNGFLGKFNNNGQRLWGTYYAQGSQDMVFSVKADEQGGVYAGGFTRSSSGIATTGAHQTTINNTTAGGGFLAHFNSGGARQWGTYYGQNRTTVSDIQLLNGLVYIGGSTLDTTGIATNNAFKATMTDTGDAFFATFLPTGSWVYGTLYYGGSGGITIFNNNSLQLLDYTKIPISPVGRLFISGRAEPSLNASTTGAYQTTAGGNADGFIACFVVDTIAYLQCTYTDTVLCAGDTIQVAYGVNRKFNSSNIFTVQLSDSNGSFATPVTIGTITTDTNGTITAVIPQTIPTGSRYRLRIAASAPVRLSERNFYPIQITALPLDVTAMADTALCAGDTLHLYAATAIAGVSYTWAGPNSFGSSTQNPVIANALVAATGSYIVTANNNGCTWKDTTSSIVYAIPDTPALSSNSQVCRGTALQLSASTTWTGVQYNWWGPGSFGDTAQNPVINTVGYQHAGTYYATITKNGCTSDTGSTVVTVGINTPMPTAAAPNSPLCARQDLQLTASNITGASYNWYGPSAFTANVQNPVRANVQMGDAGAYYVYATVSGCVSDTDSVVVVVNTDPVVNIFPTPGASICQGKQVIFTAIPTNGGSSPSYNWLVNGIATGGTGTTYSTPTLNNGDAVSCAMTSTGTCATPFIDTSNAITMTVQPVLSPTVTMTADNMPPWNGGLTVTFTANPTHGGANPEYQWKRNGADVVGATGATWGVVVNALNDNEDICVVLKSSYECAVPDTALSNCITTAFTGIVGDVAANKGFKIYPNPVSGKVIITSTERIEKVEISNLLGQKLLTKYNNSTSLQIDMSGFVGGVYIIKVNDSYISRVVKE